MCHTSYSGKVQEILDVLASKLKFLTSSGICEKANAKEEDLFDAPHGLLGRLNAISAQMRRYVTGPVWREPLFTDDSLMPAYLEKKEMEVVAGLEDDVDPVFVGSV